jgi:hypothetical protein
MGVGDYSVARISYGSKLKPEQAKDKGGNLHQSFAGGGGKAVVLSGTQAFLLRQGNLLPLNCNIEMSYLGTR